VLVFTLFMPGFYEKATKRFDVDSQSPIASETSEAAEGRSRETTWLYTVRIIADHPLFGIGFGESQFMRFMIAYGFQEEYGEESLDAPHNSYLQAAVYAGIPALIAFLLANAALLRRAALVLSRDAEEEKVNMVFGLAVGIVGFLACIFTDIQLFAENVASVYWIFFGLLLSLLTSAPKAEPA
jgi:O-antigen ligase